jgi:hypothetical protein
MPHPIRLACEQRVLVIDLDRILPARLVDAVTKRGSKYSCIESSIRELGLIEPLVVFRQSKASDPFLLLDGHLRREILLDLQVKSAKCIIATDDEAYTYNHKVSRLPPIQEHFMILRAIKNGVSEDRIARTLNVDVAQIRQKRDMLDGICPEVVVLLRDKPATAGAIRELRRVKTMRQIEMAELMRAAHNFSIGYAKCLVAATPPESVIDPPRVRADHGLSADDASRIETELQSLGREFKIIEETHGKNTLNLVVLVGYLKRLLDNSRVCRFLSQNYSEFLPELQKIVEAKTLLETTSDDRALRMS